MRFNCWREGVYTDRKDTILILSSYKNRNRLQADALDKCDKKAAKRYRDMADWFAEAILREEQLLREEERQNG